MFPVHAQNEEFLLLVADLRAKLDQQKEPMDQLGDVSLMCTGYDRENDELEASRFPDLAKVQEQFSTWAAKIEQKKILARTLVAAVSEITPLMAPLDANPLSQDVLYKIRFVHKQAALAIESAHYEMIAKKTELERDLAQIQKIATTALATLKHIKQHPHARRAQLIARITRGERPGALSYWSDRATRYAVVAGAALGNQYVQLIGSSKKAE